ncbi:MAG: prepilin peptidase [Calditrichia bacterium]
MEKFFVFIFGAIFGSFLNVCIYHIPRKISLLRPPSSCPNCGEQIPFYFNIPIISYIVLRGKCFSCRAVIPLRYPAVETLTAILTLLTYLQFGFGGEFIFYTIFIYFLIVISFIDLTTKLILNKLLVYMLITGVAMNLFLQVLPWSQAFTGLVAGGLFLMSIALIGKVILRKESLGMGDVKFGAVAGYFLGWKMVVCATFLGFFFAFVVLIPLMFSKKLSMGEYFPLGPFLAVGMVTFVYWGKAILNWYWQYIVQSGI